MIAPGEVLADRYRLERRIGEGGMGEVWAATHVVTLKSAAVKVLKAVVGEGTHAHERFVREVQTTCSLSHPAVPTVHDAFVLDGVPVIVMDLLEGETLGDRLAREETLSVTDVATVLIPVIEALHEAHGKSIAHRDLKPDNIFLTADGPKLLDFGLAKLLGSRSHEAAVQTRVGVTLGTPSYMAPEQARGAADVDHRVDIWALGVILYRCLSGMRPIEGDSAAEILARLVSDAITPLEVVAPDVPAELASLVGRMLSRDPNGRPGDLTEVLGVLRPPIPDPAPAPAPAPNPPAPNRDGKRPRGLWALAVVLAAVGLVAFVVLRAATESKASDASASPKSKSKSKTKSKSKSKSKSKPDPPRTEPTAVKRGLAYGRPPRMGLPGVFLWREGEAWLMRAVSGRRPVPLSGSLTALDGRVVGVKRFSLEPNDRLEKRDDRLVTFELTTGRDGDAFAMRTDEPGCVRVDVHSHQRRRPQRVRIGRTGHRPERLPFIACAGKEELRYE